MKNSYTTYNQYPIQNSNFNWIDFDRVIRMCSICECNDAYRYLNLLTAAMNRFLDSRCNCFNSQHPSMHRCTPPVQFSSAQCIRTYTRVSLKTYKKLISQQWIDRCSIAVHIFFRLFIFYRPIRSSHRIQDDIVFKYTRIYVCMYAFGRLQFRKLPMKVALVSETSFFLR